MREHRVHPVAFWLLYKMIDILEFSTELLSCEGFGARHRTSLCLFRYLDQNLRVAPSTGLMPPVVDFEVSALQLHPVHLFENSAEFCMLAIDQLST